MLLAGIQANFGLDPRLKHSGVTTWGKVIRGLLIPRSLLRGDSFYEIYRDEAALEAHRQTPHFKLYFEKSQRWLAAPPERRFGKNLVPSDSAWR
jgi:hypothetical protein